MDLEYWQERCSICFDRFIDFCLTGCKDQFCRECFSRYCLECVKNSWGISAAVIKCPVCSEELRKEEWQRRCDISVVELYNKYNRPFKTMCRCCPSCSNEIPICLRYDGDASTRFAKIAQLVQTHAVNFDEGNQQYQEQVDKFLLGDCSLLSVYHLVFDKLLQCGKSSMSVAGRAAQMMSKRRRLLSEPARGSYAVGSSYDYPYPNALQQISALLISLEKDDREWKDLQLLHLSSFPQHVCDKCAAEFCFKCGEPDWHLGMTCLEWIWQKAHQCTPEIVDKGLYPSPPLSSVTNEAEELENIKWKLANSKACPTCGIMISRAEGCNKVDCTMCGHRFCWICMSGWSEQCGFYKCKKEPDIPHSPLLTKLSETVPEKTVETELGVPDVFRIQSRVTALHRIPLPPSQLPTSTNV